MTRTKSTYLAVLAVLLSPMAATGTPVTVIAGGAEDAGTASLLSNFMQGYEFTPTSDAFLTDLGFWDNNADGLGQSFQVGLWNTMTQVLLASAFISDADALDASLTISGGQYRYETLASAVALTGGQNYTLAFQVGAVSLSAAETLVGFSVAAFTGGPDITLGANRRFESGGAFVFPTGTTTSFWVANVNAIIKTVPEPGTLALLGLGLAGMGLTRRRREV